eukprot:SAG22_NODE_20574_length_264_cov_1.127273_2_plen_40_part_01
MANQYKDLAATAAALQTHTQGRLYAGTVTSASSNLLAIMT